MSQPHDRLSQLEAIGEIDEEAGEFWIKNPFEMPNARENLSAFDLVRKYWKVVVGWVRDSNEDATRRYDDAEFHEVGRSDRGRGTAGVRSRDWHRTCGCVL